MDALDTILENAFPGQNVLGQGDANFFLISGSNGEPRWLIPKDPKFGKSVLSQWHPFQITSQIKWMFLLWVYQAKCLQYFPYVTPIHLNPLIFTDKTDIPVIYFGTPSKVRKLVVTLIDPISAEPKSIYKIPLTEEAANNILREADILETFAKVKPNMAPRIFSRDSLRGTSNQELLKGKIADARFTKAHADFLYELQLSDVNVSLTTEVETLTQKLKGLCISEQEHEFLNIVLPTLKDDMLLPGFWLHGDFSPWNVVRCGQCIKLVDWERSQPIGLPFQDLFHFFSMQQLIKGKPKYVKMTEVPEVKKFSSRFSSTLSNALINKLYLFYLLNCFCDMAKENTDAERLNFFYQIKVIWANLK